VGDEEEVRRFEKAFGKCRTCDHIMMAHTFAVHKKGRCMDVMLTNKEEHKRCPCDTFIPKDNLEFLEWKAAQKEKKS
jgi:hypothetical protein